VRATGVTNGEVAPQVEGGSSRNPRGEVHPLTGPRLWSSVVRPMVFPRSLRQLIRATMLVIAIGWSQPSALVLCIAPNGHIAIELGQERCVDPCDPVHQTSGSSSAYFDHGDECCLSCSDFPLDVPIGDRAFGVNGQRQHPEIGFPCATIYPAASYHRVALGCAIARTRARDTIVPAPPFLETIFIRC
jgi:hypothetical protein